MQPRPLATLLATRGLDPAACRVIRVSLNPADRNEDFASTADLVRTGALDMYVRMQDGQTFGPACDVLVFAAEPQGLARFAALRTFRARRRGVAPGDIIYDYDAAHLLHSFISRARHPTFYDAFERDELADLAGKLVIRWPAPAMRAIRRADDPALLLPADSAF